MSSIKLTYKAVKEQLLREFLLEKNISKKTLTRIKFDNDGSIKVNGKEQNVRYKLKKGQTIQVTLPSEQFSDHIRFLQGKLQIIYEDNYFLIVNKEQNLPTIPSRNEEDLSLLEIVNYYFKINNYKTIPHIVTRLDKNTTGLVLIAKHRHIHALFSKLEIDKYYLALVHGKAPKYKIIEEPIAREDDSIILRKVAQYGDYAKTKMWRLNYSEKEDISLVKLKLYTGRTHQIRVHMSYIGHSLLGDELYGGDKSLIDRQALHCSNLAFYHPIMNSKIDIKISAADDMVSIIDNFFID